MTIDKQAAALFFFGLEEIIDGLSGDLYYGPVQEVTHANAGDPYYAHHDRLDRIETIIQAFPMLKGITDLHDIEKSDLQDHVRKVAATLGAEFHLRSFYDHRLNEMIDEIRYPEAVRSETLVAGRDR
jgi:hypothetical protein